MFGILIINKPLGITSHGVISRLRKTLNTRKIGHAGTLDPLATGVLVVAVGPATRFLQYLDLEPKTYVTTVKLGQSTNTYDAEGEITQIRPIPPDINEKIDQALHLFRGEITQIPPIYSAIKQDGKPAYVKARAGEEVEMKSRNIFIKEFEFLELSNNLARFKIVCSGGTYIRSLGHDLGETLGCGGFLTELTRTCVGSFSINQAVALDQVSPNHIIPLRETLGHLPQIVLNNIEMQSVRNGQPILLQNSIAHLKVVLVSPSGNVVGIANVVNECTLQPTCIIPAEVFDHLTSTQ